MPQDEERRRRMLERRRTHEPRPLPATIDRLIRTARLVRRAQCEDLWELGTWPGQEAILMEIWRHEAITESVLARNVGISLATLTRSLRRMEPLYWFERKKFGRQVYVSSTPRGRGVRNIVEAAVDHLEQQLNRAIPAEALPEVHGHLDAFAGAAMKALRAEEISRIRNELRHS
jgi:DNA-binding MarR family transcriptional regulator